MIEIPITKLSPGPRVRAEVFDLDHVARLRLAIDDLPPITVRVVGDRFAIVDGEHRASAHRFEERKTIRAEVIEADEAEALALAVEMNRPHGLPMTLAERKSAARRLVALTDWSDQVIADRCGIHRSTVAEVRPVQPVGNQQVGRRTGADGKARPASKSEQQAQRDRIAAYLTAHPDASLGEVAAATGASKMTAGNVRSALNKTSKSSTDAPATPPARSSAPGRDATPSAPAGASVDPPRPLAAVPDADDTPTVGDSLLVFPKRGYRNESEFQSGSDAQKAGAFIDRFACVVHEGEHDPFAHAAAHVPAAWAACVAADARAMAAHWSELARQIEARSPMEATR